MTLRDCKACGHPERHHRIPSGAAGGQWPLEVLDCLQCPGNQCMLPAPQPPAMDTQALANLIVVDCEADAPCPALGKLTEFGAVEFLSEATFHGQIWESHPDPANPAKSIRTGKLLNDPANVFAEFEPWLTRVTKGKRPIFVSDNPAYDFMWICDGFWVNLGRNPFGHSGRRISDFYAGLVGDFRQTQKWKSLRVTPHDHNPVHDALGNVQALKRLLAGERP